MVIMFVRLQVSGEVLDSLREERDLNLGRTCVAFVLRILCNDCFFCFWCEQPRVFLPSSSRSASKLAHSGVYGNAPAPAFWVAGCRTMEG